MRAFVLLCCLATTAYAASLSGYEYSRNSGAPIGGSALLGGSIGGPLGGSNGAPIGGSLGSIGSSFDSPLGNQNGGLIDRPAAGPQNAAGPSSAGEITKEFFTFTAPEADFNDNDDGQKLADSVRRSLRVIFIKGPENNGLENAAVQLAKSANEQRTAIYVLSKQADIGDLAKKLNNLSQDNSNKPEVHFVKYRTPEDAKNAQQAIQSQYDSLGGRSNNQDGGVAPVLDFASKLPQPAAEIKQPNAYLPPQARI